MPRASAHILTVLVFLSLVAGTARGGFNLADVQPSDRVAASKYFAVTGTHVSTFEFANLKRPIATTTTGTILVARISSTTGVDNENAVPDRFELDQNYPNPFNMSTKIVYSVPHQSTVSMVVYDILGREVASLVRGDVTAGRHTVDFGSAAISSGTYFYRLTAIDGSGGVNVKMKKMVLLK